MYLLTPKFEGFIIIIIIIIIINNITTTTTYLLTYLRTYLLTYLLQLRFHSVRIVLTLVQTQQI